MSLQFVKSDTFLRIIFQSFGNTGKSQHHAFLFNLHTKVFLVSFFSVEFNLNASHVVRKEKGSTAKEYNLKQLY